MRYWLFGILLAIIVATIPLTAFLPGNLVWIIYGLLCLALMCMGLLFRSVMLPDRTVRSGLDLISSQDFNNRLVPVGEPESDKIVTLFNTMIDKLRNERLRNMEQESFLQLLVEASPMGVMMLDFDGRVSMVNPSFLKITGIRDESDVVGREPEEVPSELVRRMENVPHGESGVIRRGDIMRYRCYHLSFIQNGFQRRFYLLESLTEEVMKAERGAYEKVIRIISHEVNNTMGGVRSVLDMLHDFSDSDDLREVVDSCDDRCERMTRFISSYADVVRVPEPIKIETDINSMINDMIPFLQGMTPPGIELSFRHGEEWMPVNLDVSLMQQVIINIVKNAVESIQSETEKSGAEGKVVISTRTEKGSVILDISNTGSPISDEVAEQLFSPFFTTKREGRGIGLTLISEILSRHGAAYSLKTGDDGLTRFTIRF